MTLNTLIAAVLAVSATIGAIGYTSAPAVGNVPAALTVQAQYAPS
jgi:hypothetical protein